MRFLKTTNATGYYTGIKFERTVFDGGIWQGVASVSDAVADDVLARYKNVTEINEIDYNTLKKKGRMSTIGLSGRVVNVPSSTKEINAHLAGHQESGLEVAKEVLPERGEDEIVVKSGVKEFDDPLVEKIKTNAPKRGRGRPKSNTATS